MAPIVITFFIFIQTTTGSDFFPIGVYSCEEIAQADSCNFNVVQLPGGRRYDWLDSVFSLAAQLDVKIILSDAVAPNAPYAHNITRISGGTASTYESESTIFSHELGERLTDFSASQEQSWVACNTRSGWLQHSIGTTNEFESQTGISDHNAYFRLKISNNLSRSPICRLYIRQTRNGDTIDIASRIIHGTDFKQKNTYQDFRLSYTSEDASKKDFHYAIYYMGTNDTLYSDKIEVYDAIADSLRNGAYNESILSTANYFNARRAMFRFYMWDEPAPDQFYASNAVNEILTQADPPRAGTQVLSHYAFFEPYLKEVSSTELFVDYYPLWGEGCTWGPPVPRDSGLIFQNRLDYLCNMIFNRAREAIRSYPSCRFWYLIQGFGMAINDMNNSAWNPIWNDSIPKGDEWWWREPSPRELRCMTWLALTYGAKGIHYWRYYSRRYQFRNQQCWVVALTDSLNGKLKRPLWYEVRRINGEIEALGDLLLDLESTSAFKSDNIPENSYVAYVNDNQIQVGTFRNHLQDYLMLVNRHCLPRDTIDLQILLKVQGGKTIQLHDCLKKENIQPRIRKGGAELFHVRMEPGQGRLFRIESYAH